MWRWENRKEGDWEVLEEEVEEVIVVEEEVVEVRRWEQRK